MIRALNHVGISVVNLERSVHFYSHVLELQVEENGTPFDGPNYESILRLRGVRGRVAFLTSPTLQLELFEFSHPEPAAQEAERPVCNYGISHFCIEVDDIAELYARWLRLGVAFHCPPRHFPGVATATYARDPDGNVIEIMQREAIGAERSA